MQATPITPAQDSTSPSEIASLLASWRLSLSARHSSPATIATYSSAVLLLSDYLAAQGKPTSVERIRREPLEAFLTDLLARRACHCSQPLRLADGRRVDRVDDRLRLGHPGGVIPGIHPLAMAH